MTNFIFKIKPKKQSKDITLLACCRAEDNASALQKIGKAVDMKLTEKDVVLMAEAKQKD